MLPMSPPRKPFKRPAPLPEPVNWNEVKVLLEAQEKNIAFIAEGMADIHPRIVRLEKTAASLTEDMKLLRPAVQKNTASIHQILKDLADMKAGIERIEKKVDHLDERLSTVESRP